MPTHEIPPVYDEHSRILILGSFPSVASREEGFFYAYPRNRFWSVTAALTGRETPVSIDEKKALLTEEHIALWDVIASCSLTGSSDSSIRNATGNDIGRILGAADIRAVFTNGKKAHELYGRLILPATGREDICLPSTSPANAAVGLAELTERWSVIRKYLY